jgi:hypothetical protein
MAGMHLFLRDFQVPPQDGPEHVARDSFRALRSVPIYPELTPPLRNVENAFTDNECRTSQAGLPETARYLRHTTHGKEIPASFSN